MYRRTRPDRGDADNAGAGVATRLTKGQSDARTTIDSDSDPDPDPDPDPEVSSLAAEKFDVDEGRFYISLNRICSKLCPSAQSSSFVSFVSFVLKSS
jgi:hypothetical protein